MRKKDNPIVPGNDISKKILELLKKKQGDTSLYNLSKYIGMQQGTLRRKLENPTGWKEIDLINNLLNYFSAGYNKIFNPSEMNNSDIKYMAMLEGENERLNNIISEMESKLNILVKEFYEISNPVAKVTTSKMKLPESVIEELRFKKSNWDTDNELKSK